MLGFPHIVLKNESGTGCEQRDRLDGLGVRTRTASTALDSNEKAFAIAALDLTKSSRDRTGPNGIASVFAGMIIVQVDQGPLQNYPILGYTCVALMVAGIGMMAVINRMVEAKLKHSSQMHVSGNIPPQGNSH